MFAPIRPRPTIPSCMHRSSPRTARILAPVRPPEIRLAALIATLAFLDLAMWLTAVPLIPVWEDQLGLTPAQSGLVLGAYGASVLFLSLPAGQLADRIGPRRLTIGATLLFAATA